MNLDCLTRKRIWEVDCLSVDASIAASFDWRDLVNLLQSAGHRFDFETPEALLEMEVQNLIHRYCHSENAVSLRVESLLNQWHGETIRELAEMSVDEICHFVMHLDCSRNLNLEAFFWALGSDDRDRLDCVRRRLHQHVQIFLIRNHVKSGEGRGV